MNECKTLPSCITADPAAAVARVPALASTCCEPAICDPCKNAVAPLLPPTSTSGTSTLMECGGKCGVECCGN